MLGRDSREGGGRSSLADADRVIETHMFRWPAGSSNLLLSCISARLHSTNRSCQTPWVVPLWQVPPLGFLHRHPSRQEYYSLENLFSRAIWTAVEREIDLLVAGWMRDGDLALMGQEIVF